MALGNVKHQRYCYKCLDRCWLIECKCGCGNTLPRFNKHNVKREYINGGHVSRTEKFNSRSTICNRCHGKNFIIECKCGCGLTKFLYDENGKKRYFIHYHNLKGKNHHMFNNYSIILHGYKYIRAPNHRFSDQHGYVLEHRLVWELFNKVSLLPWADVHHKDKNTLNNDINNLEAMMHVQHLTVHHKKDMTDRFCLFCHTSKTRVRKTGWPLWLKYNNGHLCTSCWNIYFNIRKKIEVLQPI